MSDNLITGKGAQQAGRLILVRHGQTEWSVSGQHTGRTDLPLTEAGCEQARAVGERLRGVLARSSEAPVVLVSPLLRARQTARLAGFDDVEVVPDIAEWDYGRAEGRTRRTVADAIGREWELWRDGVVALPEKMSGEWDETLGDGSVVHVRNGRGEALEEVAQRAQRVVDRALPWILDGRDVVLVAHAHVLRILTTRWLDADASLARRLRLETAHYGILGLYKGDRVIERWNV